MNVHIVKRAYSDDPDTIEVSSTQERADAVIAALPLNDKDDKHYAVEIEVDELYNRLMNGTLYYSVTLTEDDTTIGFISIHEKLSPIYVFRTFHGRCEANVCVAASSQAEAIEKARVQLAESKASGEYERSLKEYDTWREDMDRRFENRYK